MNNNNKNELAVIIAVQALAWAGIALLSPILPLYLTSINITPSLVGAMLAVAMAGMVLGEIFGGWIGDKIGLKFPFYTGTFLCVPLVIFFAFTHNTPQLFLIFLSWGIARATIFGPGRGYIATAGSFSNKTTLMGIFMAVESFGGGLGSLAGGLIADHLGYNWDFYISAGISAAAGILVLVGLPKIRFFTAGMKYGPIPEVALPRQQNTNAYQRDFALQCIVSGLFWWGSGAMSFLPLLATEVVGTGATQVGILFTVIGLVEAILYIPMGRLADRKGKTVLMILGLLLLVLTFGGVAFIKSYPLLILFSLFSSLSAAMFSPAAIALISDTVPVHRQSTGMGIYGATAEDAGYILGAGLGGIAWSAWGPASFLLASGAGFFGVIICGGFIRDKAAKKGRTNSVPGLPNDNQLS